MLENKIYDQDYHFSTYQNSPVGKTASGLALVAAHKVSEKHPPGWKVVTWSDVVRKLRSTGLEESGLIGEAFCKYIERVCQMPIIERVDLANAHLQSLYYMYNLFLKIIQDYSHSDYFCKVYSAGRSFGPGRMGQHFQITVGEKSVYPWFGIMFSDVQPKISILFENDWCPQMVQAEFPKPRPDLYEVKKQEGKYIVFSQHRFEEFSRADKEAQEQLLVSFFRTVVDQIPDVLRR